MKLIESRTLASTQSSIVFSDIPQDFSDLYLVVSARDNGNNGSIQVLFNSSTAGYLVRRLDGYGSGSAYSGHGTDPWISFGNTASQTSNNFGNSTLYVSNYSGSAFKNVSVETANENNATASFLNLVAARWDNTAAITSITLDPLNGDFVAGTTASLYGIGGAGDGYQIKAIGGIVSFIDGYVLHTFTSSGAFIPTENLSDVEYLVIAGGAGGGSNAAGGGGAGGYRSSVTGELSGGNSTAESKLALTSGTSYTVTVGAGGAGAPNSNSKGSNGTNSVFGAITSIGGGGGGSGESRTGASGGSGGGGNGGSVSTNGTNAGGTGTANQGFDGSIGQQRYINFTAFKAPGGGGGAGEIGQIVGGEGGGGRGGNGISSSITGSAVSRAGGGGGGTLSSNGAGGSGGGGTGGMSPTAGASNTGGGGGGHGSNPAGANGGSGIVIVRYAA